MEWVCDFSPQDISSHETFSLHPDPNHNPNPNPNTNPDPNFAIAVTCLKIRVREMYCLEMIVRSPMEYFSNFSHDFLASTFFELRQHHYNTFLEMLPKNKKCDGSFLPAQKYESDFCLSKIRSFVGFAT